MIPLAALAMLVATPQDGPLPVQKKLEQLDRTFICPEDLPSDEARENAVKLFIEQLQAIEPNLTIRNLVEYRQSLLVKHRCTATLEYQAKHSGPNGQ